MTFTNIKADVQSALGITLSTTSRVTTTEVERWINESYRELQSKLANVNVNFFMGEIVEMDTVDGTGRYQLPTGFLAMKRLEVQFSDNKDKVKATPADINDIQATVDPASDPWSQQNPFYCAWEDDFYIKPVPDESSASWDTDSGSAMKLWFVELQADLSGASDVPALPSTYHHILAYPATANGFRKLRKFTEAREYAGTPNSLWETGLRQMIAENVYKDKTKGLAFTTVRGTSKKFGIWRP